MTEEIKKFEENKRYLGDGVYAKQRGIDLVLTCENGIEAYETIVLEPQVLNALCQYLGLERKNGTK
jgi:hypothetical protein